MSQSDAPAIIDELCTQHKIFIPEPSARSAVRRGLLIPHGYLHPGKSEHSEVQQLGNLSEHARVESAWARENCVWHEGNLKTKINHS